MYYLNFNHCFEVGSIDLEKDEDSELIASSLIMEDLEKIALDRNIPLGVTRRASLQNARDRISVILKKLS